jgi:hypothetical protein
MTQHRGGPHRWLTAVVLGHLVVSLAHGATHASAHVSLSPAATLFVFVVILAGPLIGLAVRPVNERLGLGIITIAMAASLVFGIVSHFILVSADHVAHVELQWRPLFAATAVLVAATEAVGVALALGLIPERESS